MKLHYLLFLLGLFIFSACNPRHALERDADNRLKLVEQFIDQQNYNAAKLEIDSIHRLFPRLIDKRKIAAALQDTIVRRESARNLVYCDSILPIKLHVADSIQKKFRFEKDTVYQDAGNWVYKTQRTENNATRTYLKAYVNEKANLYLVSNYCGPKIEQNAVKVSVGDIFVETAAVNVDSPIYFSFNDSGTHWETLTYKNEEDNGIVAFIAQNKTEKIKVTLKGKHDFIYWLDPLDKQAIAATYNLWIVRKDITQLQNQIKQAQLKIDRINQEKLKK